MATNNFLPFASTDTGTNLLTQAEYLSDSQRTIGNQVGVARLELVNKALRQSSFVSAATAQYIADTTGLDVLDDGSISTFQSELAQAIGITGKNSIDIFTVDLISDLVTIDVAKHKTVIVKDLNRGGIFIWSATGTANGGTIFAGSTGFWNRQYSGAVSIKWFGAICDGATDDSSAVQATLTFSKLVSFPKANIRIGTQLELQDYSTILGNGCVINVDANKNVFHAGGAIVDVHIDNVNVIGTGGATTSISFILEGSRAWITNCTTYNVHTSINSKGARHYISGCDLRATNSSLLIETSAEVRAVSNCILEGAGYNILITGGAGLRIENCDVLGGVNCLRIVNSSGEVSSLKVVGCFFDQGSAGCVIISPTGTGSVRRITFDSAWFSGSTGGNGVTISGNVNGAQFENCELYSNASNGFSISSALSVLINGCTIAGNISRGITLSNVTGVTITGNTIAQAAGYSANSIGVEILGTSNNYLVSGNRINGNTVAQIVDSASGATKLVTNNL